jgi:hypothetical protein
MMDSPSIFFVFCFVTLYLSARAGWYFRQIGGAIEQEERADLTVVVTAALTLLGLIIGFTFSMAVTRYDQRKDYEAAEANAIGTEYARAGLMPVADATKIRKLLRRYVEQRISFYTTRNPKVLQEITATTASLQSDLWSAVANSSLASPTPIAALAVSGMNDVLNSEGYTQAAWWNRLPVLAWALMLTISILCEHLLGYTARCDVGRARRRFALPLIVSITFFLIAEIDSPNGGIVRVQPLNLERFLSSVRGAEAPKDASQTDQGLSRQIS